MSFWPRAVKHDAVVKMACGLQMSPSRCTHSRIRLASRPGKPTLSYRCCWTQKPTATCLSNSFYKRCQAREFSSSLTETSPYHAWPWGGSQQKMQYVQWVSSIKAAHRTGCCQVYIASNSSLRTPRGSQKLHVYFGVDRFPGECYLYPSMSGWNGSGMTSWISLRRFILHTLLPLAMRWVWCWKNWIRQRRRRSSTKSSGKCSNKGGHWSRGEPSNWARRRSPDFSTSRSTISIGN